MKFKQYDFIENCFRRGIIVFNEHRSFVIFRHVSVHRVYYYNSNASCKISLLLLLDQNGWHKKEILIASSIVISQYIFPALHNEVQSSFLF